MPRLHCCWQQHHQANDPKFKDEFDVALREIDKAAENIREHRNTRIAHFDRGVTLKESSLPEVKFKEIEELIDQIESCMNLFYIKFEGRAMAFSWLDAGKIYGMAPITAMKARAYDALEGEGVVPKTAWILHKNTGLSMREVIARFTETKPS